MVRQRVEIVKLEYAGITDLIHRSGCAVYHVYESKITSNLFAGTSRREQQIPRLMMMEEIHSDYYPNEDK